MRSLKRFFVLLFAVAMLMTCFPLSVSAGSDVIQSGSVDGKYTYVLHSDGLLEIVSLNMQVNLDKLSKECLEKATSLSVDVTGNGDYCSRVMCRQSCCNIKKFKFISTESRSLATIEIDCFPKFTGAANSIVLSENCSVGELQISNSNITSFDFLKGLKYNKLSLVRCVELESLTLSLPCHTCEIVGCYKLTKIDLRGCTNLISAGIMDNDELKELYFPDSLKSFTSLGCYYNPKLTEIKIPGAVTKIPQRAFAETSLKTVDLPEGVTVIEKMAFSGVSSLQKVYIPTTLTDIDATAFEGCSLKTVNFGGSKEQFEKINVKNGSISIYKVFGDAKINYNCLKKTGWVQEGNNRYYYNDAGVKVTGWKSIDGSKYLFDDKGVMLKNWQKSGNVWYYLGDNGVMRTGWQTVDNAWYYFGFDGCMRQGWQTVGNAWYYFGSNGVLRTGWQSVGNAWYYFGNNGVMRTGWQSVGKDWYYFGSDGQMRQGWQTIGGKWYYFGDTGSMKTGWQSISGVYYYFESSGAMVTGWKQISGNWYFFKSNGAMAAGEYCNGYWLNPNGTWTYKNVARWTKDSKGWWYGDSSGWFAKSQSLMIDGKVYNFNSSGYCTNP